MSKQYLKMADGFKSGAKWFGDALREETGAADELINSAVHAIDSHDELVEQNENMKLRINQLLSERNATGVAIENALNGILPEQHSMINRLQMIAGVAANRDELVAENERLNKALDDAIAQIQDVNDELLVWMSRVDDEVR